MGLLLFFGCLLIVFGPPLAIFIINVQHQAILVLFAIGGTFFWLLSILLSAALWYSISPLRTVFFVTIPVLVLLQEGSRWVFFKLYEKVEKILFTSETKANVHFLAVALAGGLGYAICYSLVMYTGILAESAGPGATFVKSCGAVPVFLLSALLCLCFELLHICFGILTFVGYRKKAYWMIGFVIVAHLAASLVTILNTTHGWFGCIFVLVVTYAILAVTGFVTARITLDVQRYNRYYQLDS